MVAVVASPLLLFGQTAHGSKPVAGKISSLTTRDLFSIGTGCPHDSDSKTYSFFFKHFSNNWSVVADIELTSKVQFWDGNAGNFKEIFLLIR